MTKKSGIVRLYDKKEGFGYIETATGVNILVHKDGIINGAVLQSGSKVTFEQHKVLGVAINVMLEN